jgi:hypothetical protein
MPLQYFRFSADKGEQASTLISQVMEVQSCSPLVKGGGSSVFGGNGGGIVLRAGNGATAVIVLVRAGPSGWSQVVPAAAVKITAAAARSYYGLAKARVLGLARSALQATSSSSFQ